MIIALHGDYANAEMLKRDVGRLGSSWLLPNIRLVVAMVKQTIKSVVLLSIC